MYLNVYLARCGVCSRRKATELIKDGEIRVNGVAVTTPSYEVQDGDKVLCGDRPVRKQEFLYIMMNKPAGVVTSCEDEKRRQTVVDFIKLKKGQRVFPVGRLDKATTGILLLTNDGDWAQKLAHPKHRVRKTYIVKLDNQFEHKHMEKLAKGMFLSDGKFIPDRVYYPKPGNKWVVGIDIHSGRHRIIRRAFRALGFYVNSLERTKYGSLTLKGLPKGTWRLIKPESVES